MYLLIISVLVVVLVSAMCSLLEATLLSLTPSQVADITSRHPSAGAIWQRFKRNIERPIGAVVILNTAVNTIGATVTGALFQKIYHNHGLSIFAALFAYMVLQFGEILPKTIGVRYGRRLAVVIARPLDLLVRVLSPLNWLVQMVNRPFKGKGGGSEHLALREIMALASSARVSKLIDSRQEHLIRAASRLPELRVRQIMTPRTQVKYLRVGDPLSRILQVVQGSEYTRLPLCHKDMDHVIGIVHVKDLFKQTATDGRPTAVLRRPVQGQGGGRLRRRAAHHTPARGRRRPYRHAQDQT